MDYDLIVVGSGPAGYVAAIRAGQVGLKTALIEKDKIGGMCLNWGCIPTKSLIESAKKLETVRNASSYGIDGIEEKKLSFNWKKAIKRSERIVQRLTKGVDFLVKKNGVDIIFGDAVIKSENSVSVANRLLSTKNIIIATGSRPLNVDHNLPNELNIEIDQLLKLEELPENPVIVGHNPHAVELAQFFKMSGKKVKLWVRGSELLPDVDPFLSNYIGKIFKKTKIDTFFNTEFDGYKEGNILSGENKIPCDKIINASTRTAVLPESQIELKTDNSFLSVNDFLQTNVENIYAVGDVNGISKFAHAASAQGYHAVNVIGGIKESMDFTKIPINIYSQPEMAQLGLSEPEIKAQRINYKVTEFPLSANGKAMIEGQTEGLIRLLSEEKYGEVLGVQIIAQHATDMISEASAFMQVEATIYDIANTIHAHPTISEIYMESGFAAFDEPIHK